MTEREGGGVRHNSNKIKINSWYHGRKLAATQPQQFPRRGWKIHYVRCKAVRFRKAAIRFHCRWIDSPKRVLGAFRERRAYVIGKLTVSVLRLHFHSKYVMRHELYV